MALSILEVHSEYRFNQDCFADLTCVSYLPLYYQVLGASATDAGIRY
jgi:hypothetical protein